MATVFFIFRSISALLAICWQKSELELPNENSWMDLCC
ncbi:hypothetical protein TNIN_181001, partial [Trichonephila inaurata madagascariensis]